jgi:hypothetical protein
MVRRRQLSMNVTSPQLSKSHDTKRAPKRRRIVAVCSGAFGMIVGGFLGYFSSTAWIQHAARADRCWDGPIGSVLYLIIVAAATVVAAIVGALLCVVGVFLVSHFALKHAHPTA